MHFDLQTGEVKINTGPVLYFSPGGKKFNGKLTITNKRLICDTQFDMNAKDVLPDKMFIKWGSVGYLEINRSDICQAEVKKNILYNQLVLILTDGSKHIFNSGIFNKKILKAISMNNF